MTLEPRPVDPEGTCLCLVCLLHPPHHISPPPQGLIMAVCPAASLPAPTRPLREDLPLPWRSDLVPTDGPPLLQQWD